MIRIIVFLTLPSESVKHQALLASGLLNERKTFSNEKRKTENIPYPTQKHQSADTCHHWGACGLGILRRKNAPWA
jgi:hypothetical protein